MRLVVFSFWELDQGGLVQTSSAEPVLNVDLKHTSLSFVQSASHLHSSDDELSFLYSLIVINYRSYVRNYIYTQKVNYYKVISRGDNG